MRRWLRMMGLLLVSAVALAATPTPGRHHVVVDNSGSVGVVADRLRGQLAADLVAWAQGAKPGAVFGVWWWPAPQEGWPYPARAEFFRMGRLKVPANLTRRRVIAAWTARLDSLVAALPQVDRSPLLEALLMATTTQTDEDWTLTVYSDLLSVSAEFSLERELRRQRPPEAIVEQMLVVCPSGRQPPRAIQIVTWPGVLSDGGSGVALHARVIGVWMAFLARWAPGAAVKVRSVH